MSDSWFWIWMMSGNLQAGKLPSPWNWKLLLHGLLANIQEVMFSRAGWPELYPVSNPRHC
jgi:hypothetical protein